MLRIEQIDDDIPSASYYYYYHNYDYCDPHTTVTSCTTSFRSILCSCFIGHWKLCILTMMIARRMLAQVTPMYWWFSSVFCFPKFIKVWSNDSINVVTLLRRTNIKDSTFDISICNQLIYKYNIKYITIYL